MENRFFSLGDDFDKAYQIMERYKRKKMLINQVDRYILHSHLYYNCGKSWRGLFLLALIRYYKLIRKIKKQIKSWQTK